jgi:hypothetical protein
MHGKREDFCLRSDTRWRVKFFEKNQCEVGGDNLEKLSLYSISGRGGFLSFFFSFVQSVVTVRLYSSMAKSARLCTSTFPCTCRAPFLIKHRRLFCPYIYKITQLFLFCDCSLCIICSHIFKLSLFLCIDGADAYICRTCRRTALVWTMALRDTAPVPGIVCVVRCRGCFYWLPRPDRLIWRLPSTFQSYSEL